MDFAEYLKCELNDGKNSAGERVVSTANLLMRRQPGDHHRWGSSYGLDLMISSEQDLPMVSHGGNTLGFTSDMFVLPEHRLGVVVLTNIRTANPFLGGFRQKLLEVLFEADHTSEPMIGAALTCMGKSNEQLASRVQTSAASSNWIHPHVGEYYSADLGVEAIRDPEGTYRIVFDAWSSALGTGQDNELALTSAPWRAGFRLHVSEWWPGKVHIRKEVTRDSSLKEGALRGVQLNFVLPVLRGSVRIYQKTGNTQAALNKPLGSLSAMSTPAALPPTAPSQKAQRVCGLGNAVHAN